MLALSDDDDDDNSGDTDNNKQQKWDDDDDCLGTMTMIALQSCVDVCNSLGSCASWRKHLKVKSFSLVAVSEARME